MAGVLRAYNTALAKRPLLTQCSTAATLFATGDILAQQGIEKREKHDFARTARLAFYGGGLFAPIMHRWYLILERVRFASPVTQLSARVALDQFALTPCVVAIFYTSQSLMEGKGFDELRDISLLLEMAADIVDKLERLASPVTSSTCCTSQTWRRIPVQFANFGLVPIQLRLLVVNVVSLFWNAYLSFANARTS